VDDCDVCREIDGRIELPGGLLWDSELEVAFHVPPLLEPRPLLGHLLVTPRRHADTWVDLTSAEASEVGIVAAALAGPLPEMTGAERIYSAGLVTIPRTSICTSSRSIQGHRRTSRSLT
jgi:diadenosine tetraphosphate (Ap4A) HIT family hydrolase